MNSSVSLSTTSFVVRYSHSVNSNYDTMPDIHVAVSKILPATEIENCELIITQYTKIEQIQLRLEYCFHNQMYSHPYTFSVLTNGQEYFTDTTGWVNLPTEESTFGTESSGCPTAQLKVEFSLVSPPNGHIIGNTEQSTLSEIDAIAERIHVDATLEDNKRFISCIVPTLPQYHNYLVAIKQFIDGTGDYSPSQYLYVENKDQERIRQKKREKRTLDAEPKLRYDSKDEPVTLFDYQCPPLNGECYIA
ncbi:unnamed protein product [Didymodactylos carnosus]|uniref:Uncharacterized protein n=1 Tax=Didymodactylos carnosus TaxID=1234261 RepID=A0A8S2EGU2_9BILA|nr:unnamed protein product [Didymodactylos carnosus]CAF3946909.1 unnamed protein product [Didymodactylos carnosus]